MWTWIKGLFSSIGTFLKPLLVKLLSQTGTLLCAAAVTAVKEVSTNTTATSWQDKLNLGVEKAVAELESQGLKLGVDFFINEVIASITATIAKNYDESQK